MLRTCFATVNKQRVELWRPFGMFFCWIKRTCRTLHVLRGFMQNHAAPKNMCKKTRAQWGGWGGVWGGGGWGWYLAAPQSFTTPPEKKEKKLYRNEHTYMHAFNKSGQREKTGSSSWPWIHHVQAIKQTNKQTNNSIDAGWWSVERICSQQLWLNLWDMSIMQAGAAAADLDSSANIYRG